LIFPAQALQAQGFDVTIDFTGPTVSWSHRFEGTEPPPWVSVVSVNPYDADVVVMQRPARRWWADAIPHLQAQGIKVVVDVDDRFDKIPKANKAHPSYDPQRSGTHNHLWISEACRLADLVTTSTPSLCERYGFGHGLVLPNLVPERYLDLSEPKRPGSIGWSGSVETHPGDLEVTRGSIEQVLRTADAHFHVIGTGRGVRDALKLSQEPSTTEGWIDFEMYPNRLSELEIGIVPLQDSVFNAGKSALKMAEMASVGVAVVASPTPDNRRLNALGVGLLASTPAKWMKLLRSLTNSPDRRTDLAGRSREVMATQTFEFNAHRWEAAWTARSRKLVAA
jgi:hypothetical protein